MFTQLLEIRAATVNQKTRIEDLEYQIFNSYLKYASEQLVLKEAQAMAESQILLNSISSHHEDKPVTQLSATQASIFNSRHFDQESSNRSRQNRTAFKRKSNKCIDRHTKNNLIDVLQQIKQVCSQRTIAYAQNVFEEYQKLVENQHITDFRQGTIKRRRQRHQTFVNKESQLELRTQQYKQKIISLNVQIQRLQKKCQEQQRKLTVNKQQEQQHTQRQKAIFDNCREYLDQKQTVISNKHSELKLIERQICNALSQICQLDGCQRCQIIRSIKGQVIEYRRYYERQYEKLEKLFHRYRKIFR